MSSRFFRHADMIPYVPGEQPRDMQYVKLNTNESPYPPSARVVESAAKAAGGLNLYSDPLCLSARARLSQRYGVGVENVLLTNGSDETLAFVVQAFGDREHPFVFADITYGLYPVLCRLYGVPFQEIPLQEDFSMDLEAIEAAKGHHILLANPNAPTGIAVPVARIAALAAADPGRLVVVDEAYVDFGGESCIPLTKEYDNLLVVQTFSKSRSLAGARLGYAIGDARLIADLDAVRCSMNPYNVNSMSLAAGAAALEDDAYYRDNCRRIEKTRQETEKRLREMGFSVLPSRANFLFAAPPDGDGGAYYRRLKDRGVLVRHFKLPRIAPYVRISIGTPGQMDILLRRTEEILKEGQP